MEGKIARKAINAVTSVNPLDIVLYRLRSQLTVT